MENLKNSSSIKTKHNLNSSLRGDVWCVWAEIVSEDFVDVVFSDHIFFYSVCLLLSLISPPKIALLTMTMLQLTKRGSKYEG